MGRSDMNFIIELSKLLKLDINESKILKTFRIKARNVPPGKTRPLNVEFHNTKDKFAFLNALTKNDRHSFLDSTEFKDVKCFPDRTYLQRENLKAFKLEMETRNKQMEAQAVFGDSFDLEDRFEPSGYNPVPILEFKNNRQHIYRHWKCSHLIRSRPFSLWTMRCPFLVH